METRNSGEKSFITKLQVLSYDFFTNEFITKKFPIQTSNKYGERNDPLQTYPNAVCIQQSCSVDCKW